MTPGQGVGANTALRDAALLRAERTAAASGQKELLKAIGDYEAEMIPYGFARVADFLDNNGTSDDDPLYKPVVGLLALFTTRTYFSLTSKIPALRRPAATSRASASRRRRIEVCSAVVRVRLRWSGTGRGRRGTPATRGFRLSIIRESRGEASTCRADDSIARLLRSACTQCEVGMSVEIWVALISGAMAAGSVVLSARTAASTAQLQHDLESRRVEATKEEQVEEITSRYREPLVRAAFDLQRRIYNIVRGGFMGRHLGVADEEEHRYARMSTLFVFAEYLGWVEIVRRGVQFLDLGDV